MLEYVPCSDELPETPGRYRTYTPDVGFDIIEWDGKGWVLPQGQKQAVTHWSDQGCASSKVPKTTDNIWAKKKPTEKPCTKRSAPNSLSVVVTGRNDNYDGDFDTRLITALKRNMEYLPEAEFIYVCWNPIRGRKPLAVRLKALFPRLRCFVVNPKYHGHYCTIDQFLEYPAKNVGIRRATGEFILSTNSDVIISPEVAEAMMFSELKKDEVYRATRVDIPLGNMNVKFPLEPGEFLEVQEGLCNASGDYLMLHRETWNQLTGYCEEFPGQRLHKDSFAIYILTHVFGLPWKNLGQVTHWRHPSSWSSTHERPAVGNIHWDYKACGYTKNKDTWGLTYTREVERDGVTWLI